MKERSICFSNQIHRWQNWNLLIFIHITQSIRPWVLKFLKGYQSLFQILNYLTCQSPLVIPHFWVSYNQVRLCIWHQEPMHNHSNICRDFLQAQVWIISDSNKKQIRWQLKFQGSEENFPNDVEGKLFLINYNERKLAQTCRTCGFKLNWMLVGLWE